MPYPLSFSFTLLVSAFCFSVALNSQKDKHNFIVILTDDQDIMLQGLTPMTNTIQLLANEGATFVNAFTTSPVCCPSRSSILSGKYAHNHKTTNNSLSGGCYGTFWQQHIEPTLLPTILSKATYQTFYAGKYLNEYFSKTVPPGWSQWYGLHGNSRYYNFTVTENGKRVTYDNLYFTDYLHTKVVEFIDQVGQDGPFFAMIAPPAPHSPYTPSDRHEDLFPDVKAIRTPNFNMPSGPLEKHWLLTMQPSTLPLGLIEQLDVIQRKRWQTLMAVDDMVNGIVASLKRNNILDNTYIFYTSDNGYHIGQFAQAYDKRQPYETDIRIPLIVRGPTVAPKTLQRDPVALIDLVPTILHLADLEVPPTMDGRPLPLDIQEKGIKERQILIEYWGEGSLDTYNSECPWQAQDLLQLCSLDAACHCQDAWNNTYNCVRHLRDDLNFIYCEFKDNEHFVEAYDLTNDLYQMVNVGYDILPSVSAKYSLALMNLTACAGPTCHFTY